MKHACYGGVKYYNYLNFVSHHHVFHLFIHYKAFLHILSKHNFNFSSKRFHLINRKMANQT